MLYRHKQGTFEICPFHATYTTKRESAVEDGVVEIELEDGTKAEYPKYTRMLVDVEEKRYVHDKEWFEEILQKHEDYSNLVYEDVTITEEQQARLELVRLLPESAIIECSDYVLHGRFPEGHSHALRDLQIQLENQKLGQELSEREINEIMQGIQLSDLEIQLLELKLGV